jgi:rubredoxin
MSQLVRRYKCRLCGEVYDRPTDTWKIRVYTCHMEGWVDYSTDRHDCGKNKVGYADLLGTLITDD